MFRITGKQMQYAVIAAPTKGNELPHTGQMSAQKFKNIFFSFFFFKEIHTLL